MIFARTTGVMRVVLIAVLLPIPAARVYAQPPAATEREAADKEKAAAKKMAADKEEVTDDEIEPRIVGKRGALLLGFSGYVDKFSSSEDALPALFTFQTDAVWFFTTKLAVHGGLVGTSSLGGDSDEYPEGFGVPALYAFGGALYYFTPQSMASLYAGGEYRAQLTRRADADAGAFIAKGGFQGAMTSRVSVFLEGGYGFGFTRGDEDELISRFVGSVGLRVRF